MRIDNVIMKLLKNVKPERMTTYEVAKQAKISWSTANIYLYRMATNGRIKHKTETVKHTKKTFWFV